MKIVIIVILEVGIVLVKILEQEFFELEIFFIGIDIDCYFIFNFQEVVFEIFYKFDVIIFIGVMGICICVIVFYIEDKYKDFVVVCVDSIGCYVVFVLFGYIGGVNGLIWYVVSILGVEFVIIIWSDCIGFWVFDIFGKKYGW